MKITISLDDDEQDAILSQWADSVMPALRRKVERARFTQRNFCSGCNQPVDLDDQGRIIYHTAAPEAAGVLPEMPCPCTSTTLYIDRNCVCGRVVDECRCGSAERDG